jgi:replicative DNA helicase
MYTVGIFSLEMGADQLATRMICSSGNVDFATFCAILSANAVLPTDGRAARIIKSFRLNPAVIWMYTVGIFSLEMGADQLATRMICSSGNVDSNRLRTVYHQ